MDNILKLFFVFGMCFCVLCSLGYAEIPEDELEGTITMSGAWALYPMAVRWSEEFQKIYPKVHIDVAAGGAGKGMVDCLAQVVDIGMVSRDIYPEEIEKGAWWVSVTKDAVVPTFNEENPVKERLLMQGGKKETFIGMWITGEVRNWGQVCDCDRPYEIDLYTRSDACGAAKTWAKYLGGTQEDLLGIGVYGDPGLAEAVKKDVFGVGFNNINFVYDAETKHPVAGLRILPIDLDSNGNIDEKENFYTNRDDLVHAIATGRYPSPPARDLHFVSQGKPARALVRTFLKWVLTDGQKFVPESGYINLRSEKINAELRKLEEE